MIALYRHPGRHRPVQVIGWLRVIAVHLLSPSLAVAQVPSDSAFRADSTAVAAALTEIHADSLSRADSLLKAARTTLDAPVIFPAGSTAIRPALEELLNRKAWYLYTNRSLRVSLTGYADAGARGDKTMRQSRARVDAVRAYLTKRGIDQGRITVAEPGGPAPPALARQVRFAVSGDVTVIETPPASAEPPPEERVPTAIASSGRHRWGWGTVRIFYATDRRRSGDAAVERFYGGDESADGGLEFGRIEVTVPRVHRPGMLERPVWYRLQRDADPDKHLVVRAVQPLGQPAAFDSLRRTVARSGSKEALVIIHGYNVSFHDAALRAAQLTYDLRFDGAPVLYSWPSRGSPFRYAADRESAEWSAAHLAVFLDSLVAITGAKQLNVIAHSMGNMVLTRALARMASAGRDTVLDNVVLAAPDVPATLFEQQLAPAIRPLVRRLTVYMSANDRALWASRHLSDHLRLGEATQPILVVRGTDTIDASDVPTDLLGHGYFASSKNLIDDLVQLLDRKVPPRLRLTPASAGGLSYWRLP
jgi:esterase/lipase superfamily enzyme